MKYILTLGFIFLGLTLFATEALPINSFDYALPENNVSAFALGMGGLNVTNALDPYSSYGNPALLAVNQATNLFVAYRLSDQKKHSINEIISVSNVLKANQFKYISLQAGQFAFSYQPMASVNISEYNVDTEKSLYYDYKLDKLQFSAGITDAKLPNTTAGLNVKYLSGRLVYLAEHLENSHFVRDRFIDDKVKGFSTDIGLHQRAGEAEFGLSLYDVFSKLWWENYPSDSIQRRVATGVEYGLGSSKTSFGVQSKISKKPETTYHFGYSWGMSKSSGGFGNTDPTMQGMDLRIGAYSKDFYGADNINLTLGGGYYYKTFRFDFSLNSRGLKLADSELLFSLGLGM